VNRVLFLKREDTAACQDADEFRVASRIAITSTVRLADYVVAPESMVSVEIAGENLQDTCDSRHRVYVTYAGGVCGEAYPTAEVQLGPEAPEAAPSDSSDIRTWASFAPLPRVDVEGTIAPGLPRDVLEEEGWGGIARAALGFQNQDNHSKAFEFTTNAGGYCPTNMPLSAMPQRVAAHACSAKCASGQPELSDCRGYISAEDANSAALCVSAATCRLLCASTEDCVSLDMHGSLPRCFLNSADQCRADYVVNPFDPDALQPVVEDPRYEVHFKVPRPAGAANRPKPMARDGGYSWPQLLRFAPLSFPRGGEFTLCFCDAAAAGGSCERLEDFSTRVGTIHVSGVGCLLADQNLARATCVPSYLGGAASLRCYKGAAPPLDIPASGPCVPEPEATAAPTPAPTEQTLTPAPTPVPTVATPAPTPAPTAAFPTPEPTEGSMDTYCIFAPEELLDEHAPSDRHKQCQSTSRGDTHPYAEPAPTPVA